VRLGVEKTTVVAVAVRWVGRSVHLFLPGGEELHVLAHQQRVHTCGQHSLGRKLLPVHGHEHHLY
jgi:hypothetical protein